MKRNDWISSIESKKAIGVTVFLLFIFCVGVLYSRFLGETLRSPDEEEYLTIATNIIEKKAFILWDKPTAVRPPAYPYFLAIGLFLGSGIVGLRIIHFLLLSATGLFVYKLLSRQFGIFEGLIGLLLVILYPFFYYTAGTLYPQTLAALLLLVAVFLLFIRQEPGRLHYLAAGSMAGCLILTTPSFIFTLLFVLCWILFTSTRRRIQSAAIVFLGAALIVGPWVARNYRVFHSFVFVSTNGGFNLLMGNNENTTPTSGMVDISAYMSEVQSRQMGEIERDRFLRQKALEYIRRHPGRSIKLYFFKFLNYFHFMNRVHSEDFSIRIVTILALLTYGPLLVIGILLRFFMSRRIPLTPFERFVLLLYVLNGAFSAIFFTRIRFRIPFDGLLICVAGCFIGRLLRERGEKP